MEAYLLAKEKSRKTWIRVWSGERAEKTFANRNNIKIVENTMKGSRNSKSQARLLRITIKCICCFQELQEQAYLMER